MKGLTGWLYWMIIVLLFVIAIDCYGTWLKDPAKDSQRFLIAGLTLDGLVILLAIFPNIKRKR